MRIALDSTLRRSAAPVVLLGTILAPVQAAAASVAPGPRSAYETAATPSIPPSDVARAPEEIASGETRHSLVGAFDTVVVLHEQERLPFHYVPDEVSYSVVVKGPGELRVWIHPLTSGSDGREYSLVVLEDDVLLRRLDDTSEPSSTWAIAEGQAIAPMRLARPKGFEIEVGEKIARFDFQISSAGLGMLVRYEFRGDQASLAELSLDPEEVVPVRPTIVTEIDFREKVIRNEAPDARVLAVPSVSVAVSAGAYVPPTAIPGPSASLELAFPVPVLDQMLFLGVEASVQQHGFSAQVWDPSGGVLRASASSIAVPLMAKAVVRWELWKGYAVAAEAAGGMLYAHVDRARGIDSDGADAVLWAVRGGAGAEMQLGPGWIGPYAIYQYAPTHDFGGISQHYSPRGAHVLLRYRLIL